MRKTCLLIFMIMVLCLTACKADKNNETSECSNAAPEITADTTEIEAPASANNVLEAQPQTEEAFELTEQGKAFLMQMCKTLNDFDSQTTKDEAFWRNFLFYSYTGALEGSETEQVHREDLGFDETVVKVSLQEAEAYAKLVFGTDLPDTKPSFDIMEKGQTTCYYQDGYYYIGVSDFPDYQYAFADYEESDHSITVRFTIDFEGESNVGTISFNLVPEANKNGFIIASKITEFSN